MNKIKHLGIILDGNGRWAKKRGLNRSFGHKEGLKTLEKIVPVIFKSDIEILSIYVFSTENFKRPEQEVNYLMKLFSNNFSKLNNICNKNNIKIVFSGRRENLPKSVLETEDKLVNSTKNNTSGILNICLNYGGQSEIVDMVKNIIDNRIASEDINEEMLYKYLYQDLPPMDLLIRTGGNKRISNFMLYSLAYSEFYFTDTYFPDFSEEELLKALNIYNNTERRFGGLKDETKSN